MAYSYGGFQDYERSRQVGPYGGQGAYGVYAGDRDYDRGYGYGISSGHGYNPSRHGVGIGGHIGGYGAGVGIDAGRTPYGGYGAGVGGNIGSYGGSVGGALGGDRYGYDNDYDYTTSRRHRTRGIGGGYGGSYGTSYNKTSRRYRDTDRYNRTAYRNKRDTSTSSSSTSDDDNREGFFDRVGDKIKGVFGYGPEANRNNNYDNSYGSSRRGYNDRYNTSSYNKSYNTGSYGNYGSYGGGYGGYGNDVVSLRGKREIQPSLNEESGNKSLLWQVNVRGFDLDDIRVTDAGNNKIEISGHAEDVGQHHRRTKQFTRIITLPEGSNAKEVKSRVSGNGLLTITVPYTGKGLKDYGTRELTLGQGSTGFGSTTNRTGNYGSNTTGTTGGQYHSTTTTSTQRTSTNA